MPLPAAFFIAPCFPFAHFYFFLSVRLLSWLGRDYAFSLCRSFCCAGCKINFAVRVLCSDGEISLNARGGSREWCLRDPACRRYDKQCDIW